MGRKTPRNEWYSIIKFTRVQSEHQMLPDASALPSVADTEPPATAEPPDVGGAMEDVLAP